MLPYTLTDTSITVLGPDFEPKTMPATHPAFEEVVAAVKAGDDDIVQRLMDLPSYIADFMEGTIQVHDRVLYFNGKPLDTSCTRRILQFIEAGDPEHAKPLCNFLEKVMENPSRRAVIGLYDWAERSGLPITPEGDLIAWKIVKEDYKDIYSGRFDNSVGKIVEVPRYEVDEDPDRTCSHGLHVCSTKYLPEYGTSTGSRVMVVRVHPKDFVAVPRDYDCSKARVCRYEVIGEMPREKAKTYLRNQYVYEPAFSSDRIEAVLDTDIEVGRYYRARNGDVVEITGYDESEDTYMYDGRVVEGEDVGDEESYTYDGLVFENEENDLDLIEELPIDYEPEMDLPEEPKPSGGWLSRLISGLTS